jgi:protein-L-isoaspartate O-methyltransferase
LTSTVETTQQPGRGYAFSNSSDQATTQLSSLAALLDPVTTRVLAGLPVKPGMRCLEVGAGSGSIAAWLAHQVGAAGRVVALDLDPSCLPPTPGVEIVQHDIRTGVPDGPFDLIHARLVLVHLPERQIILQRLVDTLAPGGWLVLGEFGDTALYVYAAPNAADAELFTTVTDRLLDVLRGHGVDTAWADGSHSAMVAAGLREVRTVEHAESWTGGGPGCALHASNSLQKHSQLTDAGLSPETLAAFRVLMENPGFAARSYRFVVTAGRKPAQDQQ